MSSDSLLGNCLDHATQKILSTSVNSLRHRSVTHIYNCVEMQKHEHGLCQHIESNRPGRFLPSMSLDPPHAKVLKGCGWPPQIVAVCLVAFLP